MTIRALILTVAALAAATPALAMDCSKESSFKEVSTEELAQLVDSKAAFIVDVNSEDSYKSVHVPGAIHFGSKKAEFAKMLPAKKDAAIVAYCGGPKCGAWKNAAEEACKLGYTNVRHYKGGIEGWKKHVAAGNKS